MRWSEPCGDAGRLANVNPPPHMGGQQVTDNPDIPDESEIPCRVSSDLHEWRNDLGTVSTGDSAKLQYE